MPIILCTIEQRKKQCKLQNTWKTQKKRASTQSHHNLSLIKGFKRSITGGSYGLTLKAEHSEDLWFMTTQPWSSYSKIKEHLIFK